MVIRYKSKKIEKICTDAWEAQKKHGKTMAEKIHQRIDEIKAASSVEEMIQFKIGRCHSLSGDRKNQYAVDLIGSYRLVFNKISNEIEEAYIIEIVDYH